MSNKVKVHLTAALTIVLWATASPLTKYSLSHYTPIPLGALRYLLATLVLIPVVLIKKVELPKWKDLPWILLSGFFGFAGYMIAFNMGVENLDSASIMVLVASSPIFIAILAAILFKEKIKPLGWVAIALEMGGILLMALWNGVMQINPGYFWGIASAIFLALYNLIQRRLTRTYSAMSSTAYSIFAGTLMLVPFMPQAFRQMSTAPLLPTLSVVFLGIFPAAIAYVMWSYALKITDDTATVSNYMFANPVLSAVYAYFLLGETIHIKTLFGGILVLGGIFLYQQSQKNRELLHHRKKISS